MGCEKVQVEWGKREKEAWSGSWACGGESCLPSYKGKKIFHFSFRDKGGLEWELGLWWLHVEFEHGKNSIKF